MSKINNAVEWAVGIANDDSHGYDQEYRWGPDYDCSALVISAWEQAGVKVKTAGASNTRDMKPVFLSNGFEDVISQVTVSSGKGLKRGDVILGNGHVAMVVADDGATIVHASQNEFGGVTGGQTGDQTGEEICTRTYYNHPWNSILRYTAEGTGDIEVQRINVKINGEVTAVDSITNEGNNYVKLQDLNSTTLGISYNEMPIISINDNQIEVKINGEATQVSAINVEGNNYIKLQDLNGAVIKIGYDGVPTINVGATSNPDLTELMLNNIFAEAISISSTITTDWTPELNSHGEITIQSARDIIYSICAQAGITDVTWTRRHDNTCCQVACRVPGANFYYVISFQNSSRDIAGTTWYFFRANSPNGSPLNGYTSTNLTSIGTNTYRITSTLYANLDTVKAINFANIFKFEFIILSVGILTHSGNGYWLDTTKDISFTHSTSYTAYLPLNLFLAIDDMLVNNQKVERIYHSLTNMSQGNFYRLYDRDNVTKAIIYYLGNYAFIIDTTPEVLNATVVSPVACE